MTIRPPGFVTRTISARRRTVGREHRPEDGDDEIERLVGHAVRWLASPCSKRTLSRPSLRRAGAGLDQVPRDVDDQDVGAEARRGQRGRAVAAAEVEDVHAVGDPELLTSSSPLSRMVAAIRVKSPFSHSAWLGLTLSKTRSDIPITFQKFSAKSRARWGGERTRPGNVRLTAGRCELRGRCRYRRRRDDSGRARP